MKLGDRKTVFAWLPIERLVRVRSVSSSIHDIRFYKTLGIYWLRKVTLVWTMAGWRAYADDNDKVMEGK